MRALNLRHIDRSNRDRAVQNRKKKISRRPFQPTENVGQGPWFETPIPLRAVPLQVGHCYVFTPRLSWHWCQQHVQPQALLAELENRQPRYAMECSETWPVSFASDLAMINMCLDVGRHLIGPHWRPHSRACQNSCLALDFARNQG